MGALRLFVAVIVAVIPLLPSAAADTGPVDRQVLERPGGEATEAGRKPSCEGSAPTHAHCLMTWTIAGAFGIYQAWSFDFVGLTRIRWETPTGYGQTTCTRWPGQGFDCTDERGGHFEVGQTLTITAFTVGSGFWKVSVT